MTTTVQLPELPGLIFLVEGHWDEEGRTIDIQCATRADGQSLSEAELSDLVEEHGDGIREVAEERLELLESILDRPGPDLDDPAWEAEQDRQAVEGAAFEACMLAMALEHPEWCEEDDF